MSLSLALYLIDILNKFSTFLGYLLLFGVFIAFLIIFGIIYLFRDEGSLDSCEKKAITYFNVIFITIALMYFIIPSQKTMYAILGVEKNATKENSNRN